MTINLINNLKLEVINYEGSGDISVQSYAVAAPMA